MNQELTTLRSAKDAISKFYSERYPDMVKNPVLLLNYLFQHSYISRPTYAVISEQKKSPNFVVACDVNEVRSIGTGNSKKAARINSAQEMLDLIQNYSDKLSNTSVENSQSKSVECSLENSYTQVEVDKIMTQCGEALSTYYHDPYPSSSNLSNGFILQPQCDEKLMLPQESLKRMFPFVDKADDYKTKTNFDSDSGVDIRNTNNEIISLEDYFDPYYSMKIPSSQASSISSSSSDVESTKLFEHSSKITNECPAEVKTNASKDKSKNNRPKKGEKRVKLSTGPTPYILDSYFDPFFKLKPPIAYRLRPNISRACVANPKVCDVREEPEVKSDKISTPEAELLKGEFQKLKSPFSILQEKSIQTYKLIPRSTIESEGEGFKCILVLDSFSSVGTGESKKQAKSNAAITLLNQLEERS